MQPTPAKDLSLKLFEGESWQIENDINEWLRANPTITVGAIQYNYQSAEYDGQAVVAPASHGVLIVCHTKLI